MSDPSPDQAILEARREGYKRGRDSRSGLRQRVRELRRALQAEKDAHAKTKEEVEALSEANILAEKEVSERAEYFNGPYRLEAERQKARAEAAEARAAAAEKEVARLKTVATVALEQTKRVLAQLDKHNRTA